MHHIFYSGFLSHALVKGYTVSFGYTLVMESSSILLRYVGDPIGSLQIRPK